MKRIAVIIPFFQDTQALQKCLFALQQQTYQPLEIFIRDNTHDNILFTAAINEGLAKYSYTPHIDYVLILNQDAYLHQNTLQNLVNFIETQATCGIACPIQINTQQQVTWGGSFEAFPAGRHRCDKLHTYTQHHETYWANGACMLIRTALIREIGLFDKNMRFICSDADFSFTARARGWSIAVVRNALVEHSLKSSSSNNPELWLEKIKLEDTLYFAKKWLNGELYKQLAYEGKQLNPTNIQAEINQFKKTLNAIS